MAELSTPNLLDVLRIAPTLESKVTRDLVDTNGHMSLPHYVAAAARAVWARKRTLGLEQALEDGMTFFITEQHGRFMGELLQDDEFSAHPQFLARSNRALHSMTFIVDTRRRRLACMIESVSVFVCKETRRSTDITPALASTLDAVISREATLPGKPPLCASLWR